MGKGDALDRVNYRGPKLTKQDKKILERIADGLVRHVLSVGDSVWFCPRKRHYRSTLCLAAAGEIPSSEQATLYGLPGLREGI